MRKIIILSFIFISGLAAFVQAQVPDVYLKEAADNNPGLQAKYKAFEALMQEVAQAKALPDPNLSVGYFISPVETRVGPQRVRFSLSQMFPWFGTLKSQGNVAALMAEAGFQDFMNARNELFYNVSAVYYQLYEVRQKQQLEAENSDILETYKTIATQKFENGTGPMADVLRTEIILQESITNLHILQTRERELKARFNLLLNRPKEASVEAGGLQVGNMADVLPDTSFAQNPLLKSFDLKIEANNVRQGLAVKQGLPKLGLGIDYVVVGERTDMDLPDNGKDIIMPMATVSIPIFRGKYKAAVKEAQLMGQQYALQKNDMRNILDARYETAQFNLNQKRELALLYEKQKEETERVLNLLFSTYSTSGKDFEEVLLMQQQLLKYGKQKSEALAAYYTALANLQYVISGNIPENLGLQINQQD